MYFEQEKLFSKEILDAIEISKNFPHNYSELSNTIGEFFHSEYNENHLNDSLEYGLWEEYSLLAVETQNIDLFEVYQNRSSSRQFSSLMNLQDVSNLLQGAYYFTNTNKRNFPAAGGIYSIDVFFINLNIPDIDKGVYLYNPSRKCLLKKPTPMGYTHNDFLEDLERSFPIKKDAYIDFQHASGIVVFGSLMHKLAIKYRNRGLPMFFLEAGALMQNFYLSSSYFGIKCCAYYAYFDDNLANLLSLNPPYELVSLSIIVGK